MDCEYNDGVHIYDRTSPMCGVRRCLNCNYHEGLVRCFCGWAADGGDGLSQLLAMGETIVED